MMLSIKEKYDRDLKRACGALAQLFNIDQEKPQNAFILMVFPTSGRLDPDYGSYLYGYWQISRRASIKKLREIADDLERDL